MEDVRENLQTTKQQLSQVEFAIANGQVGDDIFEARDGLKEVVTLLEESLLQFEKSKLLAMFDEDFTCDQTVTDAKQDQDQPTEFSSKSQQQQPLTSITDPLTTIASSSTTEGNSPNVDFLESIADLDDVSGVKCQAPYHTEWMGTQYHNAMVVGVASHSSSDDLSFDVLFLNPVIDKMKPCPFFLEGQCKFDAELCKFSHGFVVHLNCLRSYKEANYEEFREGQSCLAKLPSGIWSKATIVCVEKGHLQCTVKFVEQNLTAELNIDEVIPNSHNSTSLSDSDEDDDKIIIDTSYTSVYAKGENGDECSVPLGAWEKHTRGIGSKIMKKFGYKEGEGLGKEAQGRVVPVPIVVLPPGRSLDYCSEKKKKEGHKKKRATDVAGKSNHIAGSSSSGNVFKFLNRTIGDKQKKKPSADSKSAFKLKPNKQNDLEVSQTLVKNQTLIKNKRDAIKKLKIQISRNSLTNPVVAEQFRTKLKKVSNELKSLESTNASLESQRKMKKNFQSMIKF